MTNVSTNLLAVAFLAALASCGATDSAFLGDGTGTSSTQYLYVSSGTCYGGNGVAASNTGIHTIAKYSLSSGAFVGIVADYARLSPGDQVADVINYDDNYLLAAVETGATSRRIDLVAKDGSGIRTFVQNTTAFSAAVRSLFRTSDGGILVSKTTAVERFSSGSVRQLSNATAWMTAPASSCATSTTMIPAAIELPSTGKMLYAHAGVGQARLGMISATGYDSTNTATCLTATSSPVATAYPTAILRHSSGNVVVSYGSATATSNFVYTHDVSESGDTIGAGTQSYSNILYVYQPSKMVEDPTNGDILVANTNAALQTVERFSYNTSTFAMTRATGNSFILNSNFTKCISGLAVGP